MLKYSGCSNRQWLFFYASDHVVNKLLEIILRFFWWNLIVGFRVARESVCNNILLPRDVDNVEVLKKNGGDPPIHD